MPTIICGSLAYDTIMVFPQRFRDHILPDKTHMLNVAFLVPEMRKNFGGCAGNIAYGLKLLGDEPLPMSAVGADFDAYAARLAALAISQRFVHRDDAFFTAQAYITTDLDDNQITAFHPGAMDENRHNQIPQDEAIDYGIISPDGRQAMMAHAEQFRAAGIPFIYDPGQGLPMFSGDELIDMMTGAHWLTVNSYEWEMIADKTGFTHADALALLKHGLIVTHGSEGARLMTADGEQAVAAVPPTAVLDPTGCGDAFRAGLLFGLARQWEPVDAASLGSLMGSIKIAHAAPQGYTLDLDALPEQFERHFKRSFPGLI